jgi:hypothetical protein
MPVIPVLGRLNQKDLEFVASLGCRVRPYLKKNSLQKLCFLWKSFQIYKIIPKI